MRLLETVEGPAELPWEVVEFLVKMYADPGTPPLKHHFGSFRQSAGSSRHAMPGGQHIEWQKIGAMYNQEAHALILNRDAKGGLEKRVSDVLHEIEHYNQHIRWDSDDTSYRDSYVRGKKLPPAIDPNTDEGDPIGLYEISWDDLTKFWLRRYGYSNAPHEVEARRFASSNLEEALGFIREHF